jgi:hypothetical protein
MLHVVVRCALAAILLAAAAAKLARPAESRAAVAALTGTRAAWAVAVAAEVLLAAGVVAGSDVAALLAAAFLLASAALLARALRAGRAGAPCGCFGARSRVSRLAAVRAAALGAAFASLPLVPHDDLSADAWLAIGLGAALVAVAVLVVCVAALAREVGLLRLAVGPQQALEVPGEGPPLGADSGLGARLDPRAAADPTHLGLAVFTSEACALCRRLGPSIAALGRHPHVTLLELDEARDAGQWDRLDVPGSPYALALDGDGYVLAKGTFNTLAQLESVLATAERRRREPAAV